MLLPSCCAERDFKMRDLELKQLYAEAVKDY